MVALGHNVHHVVFAYACVCLPSHYCFIVQLGTENHDHRLIDDFTSSLQRLPAARIAGGKQIQRNPWFAQHRNKKKPCGARMLLARKPRGPRKRMNNTVGTVT